MVRHRPQLALLLLLLLAASAPAAWSLTYATINEVGVQQLTNSIQITVKADGILEWQPEGSDWFYEGTLSGTGQKVSLRFPGARSSVKNFTDVNIYPVNYVQTYVPQGAAEGVGVALVVACFTSSDYDVAASPDRQSVIITVKSKRTLEKADGKGAASAGTQKTCLECRCLNGKIDLTVLKTDMAKVLGRLAKEACLNIMVDDALAKRMVSVTLTNMTAEEVLQYLASAYGLALSKKDDVYMVCEGVPTDLATYRAAGTQSFPMRFVRAQTASELLPTFLYGYAHVNARQNAVVVSAPSQMLQKIEKDLSKVDIAPPQVMVQAVAVEFSSEDDLETALAALGQNASVGQFLLNSERGDLFYSTLRRDEDGLPLSTQFEARLKALVVSHKARIHAMPRMAVVNGQQADIFVGAQRFMRVEYFAYGGKQEKIQEVDVGTHITVSAWTGENGEITMTVAPDVSNVVELDRLNGLPTLSSRRASTTVRVKDGQTIMIGGLTQSQDYDTSRKIPVLGDLPLIGALGRSKSRTSTKTDLVIFITPRLLTQSGHLPDAAEEQRIKERMLPGGK